MSQNPSAIGGGVNAVTNGLEITFLRAKMLIWAGPCLLQGVGVGVKSNFSITIIFR